MIPEFEKKSDELESRVKPVIHFEAWVHNALNLQGVQDLRGSILGVFGLTPGRNVLYLENGGGLAKDEEASKRLFKLYGSHALLNVALMMIMESKRLPSKEVAEQRKAIIDQSTPGEIIRNKLLPEEDLQQYFRDLLLDDLSNQANFEVVVESHTKRVASIFREDLVEYQQCMVDATESWYDGDFYGSIGVWRDYHKQEIRAVAPREAEIVEELKSISRKLMKSKEGGSIFILFGGNHAPMMEMLKRKVDPQGKHSRFQVNFGTSFNAFALQVDKFARIDQVCPDDLLARYTLSNIMRIELADQAEFSNRLEILTNNYSQAEEEVFKFVSSLTFEEIKTTCESKASVWERVLREGSFSIISQLFKKT